MKPELKTTAQTVEAKDIQVSDPQHVQSIYANDFGFSLTNTDVRLIFTEVGPNLTDGKAQKIVKANIVIPFQLADALAQSIGPAIAQHRKALQSMQNAKPISKA